MAAHVEIILQQAAGRSSPIDPLLGTPVGPGVPLAMQVGRYLQRYHRVTRPSRNLTLAMGGSPPVPATTFGCAAKSTPGRSQASVTPASSPVFSAISRAPDR